MCSRIELNDRFPPLAQVVAGDRGGRAARAGRHACPVPAACRSADRLEARADLCRLLYRARDRSVRAARPRRAHRRRSWRHCRRRDGRHRQGILDQLLERRRHRHRPLERPADPQPRRLLPPHADRALLARRGSHRRPARPGRQAGRPGARQRHDRRVSRPAHRQPHRPQPRSRRSTSTGIPRHCSTARSTR